MGEQRCEVCNGELSACGDMTEDGPADDCEVCQLRAQLAEKEREVVKLNNGIGRAWQQLKGRYYGGAEETLDKLLDLPEENPNA